MSLIEVQALLGPLAVTLLIAGGTALLLGTILGAAVLGDGAGTALLRGLETAAGLMLGAVISRVFVAWLLAESPHPERASVVIGWAFLFWPGVIDLIPSLFGTRPLSQPATLVVLATWVGAGIGFMNGFWRIHHVTGLLTFPLNLTWGLGANVTGLLVHVINFAWAGHGDEKRSEAHRYASGFRIKGSYAFTQGCVMSNLPDKPGASLYSHEFLHVIQNLVAGPFFLLSYLAWMIVVFPFGLIHGLISKAGGVQDGVEGWSYDSNPWEMMAYAVGGGHNPNVAPGPVLMGILYLIFGALFIWASVGVIRWAW